MKINFIDSFRNMLLGKTNASLTREDLCTSRYISIYNYHKRIRSYKAFLESTTLDKTNDLLKTEFPKSILKDSKKEIIDCVVIFMKYISINYWIKNIFHKKLEYIFDGRLCCNRHCNNLHIFNI